MADEKEKKIVPEANIITVKLVPQDGSVSEKSRN